MVEKGRGCPMMIDRLNPIDPIQNPKRAEGARKAVKGSKGDSIAVSSEAMEKGELFRVIEMVKAAPDVRADKIAELKAKIDDPAYLNEAIISATADRILDQLL